MATEHRRLFFALDPPDAVRKRIANLQAKLDLPGQAVPSQNFHITLEFLGQVPATGIAEVFEIAALVPAPSCQLELDRIDRFECSTVTWLGCSRLPDKLMTFHRQLHDRLHDRGFRADTRTWVPHVTLYRNLRMRFEKMPFEAIAWHCEGYCLMQSSPGPDGVEYRSIGR